MIHKLRQLLSKEDKHFIFALLIFSILISIIEMVGISAIMPFISVASDFSKVESNQYFHIVYDYFSFENPRDFILAFGMVLLFFYIFRSLINLYYQYLLARFSFGRYHLIASRLFQNYLCMSYRDFISKNSATLTKAIVNEANNLTILLSAVLFMVSEFFVVVLIYAVLLFVDYQITLTLTILLAIKAYLLGISVSKTIKSEGGKRAEFQRSFYEIIGSSFGNFKIIKLESNEKPIMERFSEASIGFAHANITNQTLSHVPRLFLEVSGFSLMVAIILYLIYAKNGDITSALPLLSMYVLALYRLLPSVNRILDSYNRIMFNYRSLEIVSEDLSVHIDKLGEAEVRFSQNIKLHDICFEYELDKPIFNRLNLSIAHGEKVAFIGESGSGKSTLVDIIIGLYRPISGEILIDGTPLSVENLKSWRKKVGYIPQSVYLFDSTVGENVAFGREYDESRVISALKQANIYDFLMSKDGLNTRVGEGGVALSGGQKQRIAIARALYGNPEILVLDEATSALDNDTERKIMDEIYDASEGKTLIIIAHRLSTLERCERILHLQHGKIVKEERAILS
ncbi:MAG: ATP-binding cassette domain-containing protein [Wolinella sp.]